MNTKSRTSHPSTLHYDEKDAFTRLAKAREDKDEESFLKIRNEIMLANGGLVRSLAKKACRYYGVLGLSTMTMNPENEATFTENDFTQHGYILLAKAICKYSLSAGTKFSTFATTVVSRGLNQIFDARALKKYAYRGFVSLDCEVDDEKGQGKLGDFIPDKNSGRDLDNYCIEDLRRMLRTAISTLTPREKKVVLLSQGFGCDKLKQSEIAKMLDVTPQRVTQILKGALRKLRVHPAIEELGTVV
jgi:RNA polymerase sigma factor (sigma-70 family)